jgi:hypothetical protein
MRKFTNKQLIITLNASLLIVSFSHINCSEFQVPTHNIPRMSKFLKQKKSENNIIFLEGMAATTNQQSVEQK